MPQVYQMMVAGHPLRYTFLNPATRFLLHPLPHRVEGKDFDVGVTEDIIELGRNFLPPDSSDSYVEYRCLIELTARSLLRFGCCIFHSVAFVWRDRAWLLTAPSGVGKTTQFCNWQRLHPGEITMISGDMPALESRDDGSVWVHPSAWNGKENLKGACAAPLGGIVLLEQGSVDQIERLTPREALLPLLRQYMVAPETEEEIRRLTGLVEQMLMAVPCWLLINRGGAESTELLRETLLACMEKEAKD